MVADWFNCPGGSWGFQNDPLLIFLGYHLISISILNFTWYWDKFSSAKSCLTLCDPMDYSMPGFPVLYYLLEFAQTHVHLVGNAIQPCHPLLLPSLFPSIRIFSASWLFTSGGQSIGASALASVLPMNIQGWFPLGLTGLIFQSKGLSRVFSNTTVWKHKLYKYVNYVNCFSKFLYHYL